MPDLLDAVWSRRHRHHRADEDDTERVLTLVGDDETDAGAGRIGWSAPSPARYAVPPSATCAGLPPARGRTRI